MSEDDVTDNNLAALQQAVSVVESFRNVDPESIPAEGLLVISIVTSLDAALYVYQKRQS